jgi:hypothetical protein
MQHYPNRREIVAQIIEVQDFSYARLISALLINDKAGILEYFTIMGIERPGHVLVDLRFPSLRPVEPFAIPDVTHKNLRLLPREITQPDIVPQAPIVAELESELPACHDERSRTAMPFHVCRGREMFIVVLIDPYSDANLKKLDAQNYCDNQRARETLPFRPVPEAQGCKTREQRQSVNHKPSTSNLRRAT